MTSKLKVNTIETASGTTLTFTTPPSDSAEIRVRYL